MKSLFITGASGFVGRSLVKQVGQRSELAAICVGRSAAPAGLPASVRWHSADLLDPGSYQAQLAGSDVVLHLAGLTGRASRSSFFRVNTESTRVLLDASKAAGVPRFLFVSSVAASFSGSPYYHYAQSKRAAEALVQQSGLRTVIVRPTIVLGPGSPLGEKLRTLASGPVVLVFGNGRARIQPIHVDDLAAILLSLIDTDRFTGEVIEVGGAEDVEMQDFLERVRKAQDLPKGRVIHIPVRPLQLVLSGMERISTSFLPFTAGQLSSFTNDGIAAPAVPPVDQGIRLRSLDEMIGELVNRG
jgi:nucleoside-diphosphate-sugar epimerase